MENIKKEVDLIRISFENIRDKLNIIKNEYSIFQLVSQQNRQELVNRCIRIIEPELGAYMFRIESTVDNISSYPANSESLLIKEDLQDTLGEISIALKQLSDHGNETDSKMADDMLKKIHIQITKLS